MSGLGGSEILNFTRRDLIQQLGQKEGSRLDGQVTLSRNDIGVRIFIVFVLNFSGLLYLKHAFSAFQQYKNTRSSELRQVLEKARRKADSNDHHEESEI